MLYYFFTMSWEFFALFQVWFAFLKIAFLPFSILYAKINP